MKQTAVDWLFQELNVFGFSYNQTSVTASKEIWEEIYKKAKEIEKRQAINDYEAGLDNGSAEQDITGEQYYKETY